MTFRILCSKGCFMLKEPPYLEDAESYCCSLACPAECTLRDFFLLLRLYLLSFSLPSSSSSIFFFFFGGEGVFFKGEGKQLQKQEIGVVVDHPCIGTKRPWSKPGEEANSLGQPLRDLQKSSLKSHSELQSCH